MPTPPSPSFLARSLSYIPVLSCPVPWALCLFFRNIVLLFLHACKSLFVLACIVRVSFSGPGLGWSGLDWSGGSRALVVFVCYCCWCVKVVLVFKCG